MAAGTCTAGSNRSRPGKTAAGAGSAQRRRAPTETLPSCRGRRGALVLRLHVTSSAGAWCCPERVRATWRQQRSLARRHRSCGASQAPPCNLQDHAKQNSVRTTAREKRRRRRAFARFINARAATKPTNQKTKQQTKNRKKQKNNKQHPNYSSTGSSLTPAGLSWWLLHENACCNKRLMMLMR